MNIELRTGQIKKIWEILDSYEDCGPGNGSGWQSSELIELSEKFRLITRAKTKTWQDQPTEDGYYWLDDGSHAIVITRIRTESEKVKIDFTGNLHDYSLNEITGKWQGPIKPPKED